VIGMTEISVSIATSPSIAVTLDDDTVSVSVTTSSVSVPVSVTGVSSGGDMLASVYDPTAVSGDAFAMDNMVEGSTTKILTDAERSKLSAIEANATADQTGAEIKSLYESESDTNAFTDSEKTLLGNQSGTNTGDQDLSTYQLQPSEGAFIDGDKTKLDGIESNATADQDASEIRSLVNSATDSNVFTDTDHSKLDGIEAGANVTDAANVTAAGALMDSEVANLDAVKSFDPSDYATAAQGSLADSATQPGDLGTAASLDVGTTANEIVQLDVSARLPAVDGSQLTNLPSGATQLSELSDVNTSTATNRNALIADGTDFESRQLVEADISDLGNYISDITGESLSDLSDVTTTGSQLDAIKTKVDGIESGAEVNDPTTLVDADIGVNVQAYSSALDAVSGTNTGDQDLSSYQLKPSEGAFLDGDKTKLDGIEAGADVTPAWVPSSDPNYATETYVDNEVAGLVDSAPATLDTLNELAAALGDDPNFATTVTNSIATKLSLSGGTITGNIVMSGSETVDGRDLSADGAKLDGIESGSTGDQTGAEIKSAYEAEANTNAFTDAEKTLLGNQSGTNTGDQDLSGYQIQPSEGAFVDGDKTKLDGIESGADVTDTTNVVSSLTAGTNITIAVDGTISSTDTNTQLSSEEVEDVVGSMVTGNTESGITVEYDDTDGKLDFTVASQTDENFTTADHAKLDGIEASADVTDTANVTVAGALMDSEVTNLDQVKAFNSSDYATAAQGTLADSSTQPGDNISTLTNDSGFTGDQTASDIRALGFFDTSNDGAASGLDADLLDGNHASAFATAAQGSTADSALQSGDIDTLAELNSVVTDATLIDTSDSRLSDSRTCDNTFDNAATSRTNLGLGTAAVESAASLSPTGGIQAYAGSSSPTGWLICDGSAVSRTTYSDLFAVISTTYGVGDGSTTFNLPDISGRVIAGKEATATLLTSGGSGVDGATLGATGGSQTHQLDEDEMPIHSHDTSDRYDIGTAGQASGSGGRDNSIQTLARTTTDAGGDQPHQNTQPTIVLNYIIKM